MSSILNLNDTTPAAATGYQLAKWQRGSSPAGTDPTTGLPYYDASVETPNTGGVLKKTANYTAAAGDCGQLVSFNSGSPVTYTLSATPPVVAVSRWQVGVENIGAGALTISATSAAKLDGVTAGTLVLAQNSGCKLYTDGTDYFTERGVASTPLVLKHDGTLNGSQTLLNTKAGSGIIITDDGSGGLTWSAASVISPNIVQSASGGNAGAPAAVAFASANTLGNAIVVALCWSDGIAGSTTAVVTDSRGNTYTRITGHISGNITTEVWVAPNCAAGANTVSATTVASPTSDNTFALAIHEYSGMPTSSVVDASSSAASGSTNTLTASVTAAAASETLFIAGGYEGTPNRTATSSPGTSRQELHAPGGFGGYPCSIQSFDAAAAAGSNSVTVTWAATVSEPSMVVVAFKSTTVSGGTVTSVSATVPAWLAASVSNPTTTPAIAITAAAGQPANKFLATPDGSTGAVAERSIVAGDLPAATTSLRGGVRPDGTTITILGDVISAVGGGGGGGGGGGALVLLEQHTAAGAASLAFTAWQSALYNTYLIDFQDIVPSTSGLTLNLQVSTDGGATYDATSGHYYTSQLSWGTGGVGAGGPGSGTSILLAPFNGRTISTTASTKTAGQVVMMNPGSGALFTAFEGKFISPDTATVSNPQTLEMTAGYQVVTAINAFKVTISSGTFTGVIRVYGLSNSAGAGGGNFSPYPSSVTPPVSTDFTYINQSSSTVYDKTGRMVLTKPNSNAVTTTMLQKTASLPAAPYTIDLGGMISQLNIGGNGAMLGIALIDGSSDAVAFSMFPSTASSPVLFRMKWASSGTSISATSSVTNNTSLYGSGGMFFLRITDDGTTRSFYVSPNGLDFFLVMTEATNTGVTPTHAGIQFYNNYGNATTELAVFTIYHFLVTASVLPQISA